MKHTLKTILFTVLLTPFLTSCDDFAKPLIVTPSEIVLYSDGTKQITANLEGATFTSKDEWYAEVDATGLVTANYVGETEIIVSAEGQTKSIPVLVRPAYVLYPDLDEFIGKSKSDVISTFGQPDTENKNMIGYEYNDYAPIVGFNFENGYVSQAAAFVPNKYMSKLASMIAERYAPIAMQNDEYWFINHDKDVIIGTMVYNVTYMGVLYSPYTESKANVFEQPNMSELFNLLNN